MQNLLSQIKNCTVCKAHLPLGPRPIITGTKNSKIVLVSQAPGRKAHDNNRAWDDASGRKLREWLGVTETQFYDPNNFAVLPIRFCYPGKGKTGDLPPRQECAPLWHAPVWVQFKKVELVLLKGKYAQDQYLGANAKKNLTENVANYTDFLPRYFPLPHPSPVNHFWRGKNPWFEDVVVGELQDIVDGIL
ncbi:uracil-DNA glycosylase family protein [Maribacter chungangensis]|uniref:Uracil-DNA glycosylase family protein n=1 Tax=Maribacter chungangensis TaxID=1069117 RepID=A0ABW3B921_9FLAO